MLQQMVDEERRVYFSSGIPILFHSVNGPASPLIITIYNPHNNGAVVPWRNMMELVKNESV